MSEENVPEVNVTPDVEETPKIETPIVAENAVEAVEETVEAVAEPVVDLGSLSLAELSDMFDRLSQDENRMKRYKEAEAIKSAFYKRLSKEKAEAGLGTKVDEPSSREDVIEEVAQVQPAEVKDNPFEAMEAAFKGVYANYKRERAEYNRQQDAQREENFVQKQAVIEDLKTLVEKQEDISSTFPAFRELQNRWREIGPVPATKFRDLNDTYQFYVEKFYDMVKINRDLRDLDFKKNLEAKEEFCQAAEKLAENENVVEAFRELQKLHEQWKEFGPVAKEFRDSIWDRFKAATAVINKKYQAYFEGQKEKQQENLEEKTKLCEQVEAIAEKEVKSSNEWNQLSSEIEEIQKKWRTIGFATKKENQKIYDRFRAACDKFFARKREYYSQFKDSMNENMDKKIALIEKAEALKDSKEWKKTTEALIELQKQWKEIGAVPRKKSEQLWKRFRAACDAFFTERDKNSKPENDYYGNLKAKRALIDEINAYESKGAEADQEAAREFAEKWRAIGFVPYKEKENVQKAYSEAFQAKFPDFSTRRPRTEGRGVGSSRKPLSEKDRLVQEYNKLQQDIVTYENNIGFFSASKNSEPLIKQMQERIEAAKVELKELEAKILKAQESEEEK
ncbi:MAG: DUF349 domain-containing protein [Bacteroidales bacterium]|nr:DUF349 domain-containing protein [Bacteroidales bacterium]